MKEAPTKRELIIQHYRYIYILEPYRDKINKKREREREQKRWKLKEKWSDPILKGFGARKSDKKICIVEGGCETKQKTLLEKAAIHNTRARREKHEVHLTNSPSIMPTKPTKLIHRYSGSLKVKRYRTLSLSRLDRLSSKFCKELYKASTALLQRALTKVVLY